jgi:hypothetical protein
MFLGSLLAGALSSAMLSAGLERGAAYTTVFVAAGVVQLLSVAVALSAGRRLVTETA